MQTQTQTERIDWNRLWKENYADRPSEDDHQFWDDYAPRFRKKLKEEEDPYVRIFYEYSEFQPGETIFDMGCASGTLAIPFAQKGHEIWAADFSEEMLKYLMIEAEEAGVADRIHPIRLDWNEDWSKGRICLSAMWPFPPVPSSHGTCPRPFAIWSRWPATESASAHGTYRHTDTTVRWRRLSGMTDRATAAISTF